MLHRIATSLLRPYTDHLDRRLDELRDQITRIEHIQNEWIRNLGQWAHEEGVRTRNIEDAFAALREDFANATLTLAETGTYLDRVAAEFAEGGPTFAAASAESVLAPFVFSVTGAPPTEARVLLLGSSPSVVIGFAALRARVCQVSPILPRLLPNGVEFVASSPQAWAGPETPADLACWIDGSAGPDAAARLTPWIRPGGACVLVTAAPSPLVGASGWRVTAMARFQRTTDGFWARADEGGDGILVAVHAVREG